MSIVDDVLAHLTTNSLIGGASGWTGFKDFVPPDPDKVVIISPSGGAGPEKGFALRYPNVQIRVRGEKAGYAVAQAKLEAIYQLLHAVKNENLNSVSYAYIIATGDVLPLGQDENGRPELTRNFRSAINN